MTQETLHFHGKEMKPRSYAMLVKMEGPERKVYVTKMIISEQRSREMVRSVHLIRG